MAVGVVERSINLSLSVVFFGVYEFVYQNYKLFEIPNHWVVYILLLLATDFIWYWYHRLSHEINILWGFHVVHHQSEEYNFSVAARITSFQAVVRNSFWCVLPFVGFDPFLVIVVLTFHGAYSFFTHTEIVNKLGFLEKILITPSHHRVHHSSNMIYLDKNYGDVFVFWDKIFGTFVEESEKPTYGLTHQLIQKNFLWQHLHYFLEIIEKQKQTYSFVGRLAVLFESPSEMIQSAREVVEARWNFKISNRKAPKLLLYCCFQMLLSLILLSYLSFSFHHISKFSYFFSVLIIVVTQYKICHMLDTGKLYYKIEIASIMLCFLIFSNITIHLIFYPFLYLIVFIVADFYRIDKKLNYFIIKNSNI